MPVISCPDCARDVSTIAAACPHCGRPSPAGTAPMAAAAPPPPARKEETLWRGGPSHIELAGYIAGIIAALVIIPIIGYAMGPDVVPIAWMVAIGIAAILLIGLLVAWIKLRSISYTVTNQRVIVEHGVFSKAVEEIDLRYIDDSQFTQTFSQRLLGIGNITLISSDRTSPRYVLRSIRDPRGVRELIRAEAYQSSQRQVLTRDVRI